VIKLAQILAPHCGPHGHLVEAAGNLLAELIAHMLAIQIRGNQR
jgi:hypothetical protein